MASAAPAKHAESRVSFSTAAPDLVSEGSQDQVRSLPVISLGGGVQLASSVDLAVIWVNKAAKGSSQWVQSLPQKQLACYYFRKKLKPVTVLLKYAFLSLAIFERPSWCLGKQHCLETEGVYSWNIPQLPFQVSNSFEIVCLAYFFFMFGLRRRSLGEGAIHSRWHCARLVLLIVSLADCLVAVVNTMGIVPGSFRLCRLCRPLIFLSATKFIRNTWNRLSLSFWDFWTVLASLALCVLFFVWLGIVIFAKTKEGQNHFDSWSHSAASLWILFTTANYPDVMVDAYTSMRVSFFFFFIYLVISLYLLNNILLAAVYDAYKEQMRKQLQEFYRNKSTSIDHAFELLCEPSPEDADASSEAAIRFEKWMSFFTAYGISVLGQGSQRDNLYIRQQGLRTFQLLDSDGSGSISREEFKIVVHALADPHIYIPMRPIPEAAGTCWGRRLRRLFQDGVKLPFVSKRIRWESVVDIVVLIEILLALAQTWIFVSPLVGGKFNDESLSPGSVGFVLLTCLTGFFLLEMLARVATIGPGRFWNRKRIRNRFDVLSISTLAVSQITAVCYHNAPDYLLRTILALHIVRGICLTQHVKPLLYLVAMVARLVPVYRQLGLLLFLVYYIFATIGLQIFGGRIYEINPKLVGRDFATAGYWALNFNDFPSGLVTLFVLMVVNNWFVVADGFMAVTNDYAAIFFVLFFVTVNLIVLNILIALILESSAAVREELQRLPEEEEDQPRRSWSQRNREFVLQRLLFNEEERLESVVSGHHPGRSSAATSATFTSPNSG